MGLKIATAPAVEPITLTEAKAQCRVDITDDDALITALIVAARTLVEQFLGRALCTQTWDLYLDAFPAGDTLSLPLPPLATVSYVKYTPASTGIASTFAAASYTVDAISTPGRLRLNSGYSWPSDTLVVVNGVNVRFVAGYGAAAAAPAGIVQAIKLLVGHWYENREAIVSTGAMPKEIPFGIAALLWPERVVPV
jgi:uncharacterized phiE125 gp8 family phage protein